MLCPKELWKKLVFFFWFFINKYFFFLKRFCFVGEPNINLSIDPIVSNKYSLNELQFVILKLSFFFYFIFIFKADECYLRISELEIKKIELSK